MSVPLILVAASGLAREVMSAVEAGSQHTVVGLLDDQATLAGTEVSGVPVLGTIDEVATVSHPADVQFLICAGKGASRRAVVDRLSRAGVRQDRYATVVDPTVRLPRTAAVGPGSVLLAGCVLTADVSVGRHVVAMPGVTLTHDDRIDDFATLCAGVTLGGSVHVGEAAYLGMSSSVRERIVIGPGAVLGMGSVLINDLPADSIWVGNPAKPLLRTTH